MSVYTKITFKAPKLVEFLKEKGIDISSKNGVFYEASDIKLPSGLSACIFDEDAWGATLYGPEEMSLPRDLGGIDSGDSFVLWLVNQLVKVGEVYEDEEYEEEFEYDDDYCEEDEFFSDDVDNCMDFCKEIKNIFEEMYPDKKSWKKIGELDDLIEEAKILYFNYWDGTDFEYTYAEIKDNKAYYWDGVGEEEPEVYEDWCWRNLEGFIKLVKDNIPATTYTRKNSKWVKE